MRSILAFCSLAALAAPAVAQNPRANVDLDPGPLSAGSGRSVSTDGVFAAQLFKDFATDGIYIVSSADSGLTWSAPVQIDLTAGSKFMQDDSVHVIGGTAYCGWSVTSPGGASGEDDFAYTEVDITGALPVVTLPEILVAPSALGLAGGQIRSYEFEVCAGAAGRNAVFVANFDPTAASMSDEIWVTAAPLGGPFIPPFPLSVLPTDADEFALACDGDDVVVVWNDNSAGLDDSYLTYNPTGGAGGAWTAPIMANALTTDDMNGLDVDVKFGTALVGFLNQIGNTGGDEPTARLFALGAVPAPLSPELPVTTLVGGGFDSDEIAVRISAAANLVAMWDYSTAGDEIYTSTSTTAGASWIPDVKVSSTTGGFIVMDEGRDGVVVGAWTGGSSPNSAESAYSCDDGLTWTTVPDTNTLGGDVDFAVITYDERKRNVITGHNTDAVAPPANDAVAGGYAVCVPAVSTPRVDGFGPCNPSSLTVGPVALGGSLDVSVDLTTTGHSTAVIFGFDTPLAGIKLGGGQVLLCIDSGSGELLSGGGKAAAGPLAMFSCPVPNDPCLLGFTVCIQAIHAFGVSPFALSNAYDVTVGSM